MTFCTSELGAHVITANKWYKSVVCFPTPVNKMNLQNTKLVLIADSHGYKLPELMKTLEPDMEILDIIRSGATCLSLAALMEHIHQEKIKAFQPDNIIFLAGSNNVGYHRYKNTDPDSGLDMIDDLEAAVKLLQGMVPSAKVWTSALFPRGPSRFYNEDQVAAYNDNALRLGRKACQKSLNPITTKELWTCLRKRKNSKKSPTAKLEFYNSRDNFHLNPDGKKLVAKAFLTAIGNKKY